MVDIIDDYKERKWPFYIDKAGMIDTSTIYNKNLIDTSSMINNAGAISSRMGIIPDDTVSLVRNNVFDMSPTLKAAADFAARPQLYLDATNPSILVNQEKYLNYKSPVTSDLITSKMIQPSLETTYLGNIVADNGALGSGIFQSDLEKYNVASSGLVTLQAGLENQKAISAALSPFSAPNLALDSASSIFTTKCIIDDMNLKRSPLYGLSLERATNPAYSIEQSLLIPSASEQSQSKIHEEQAEQNKRINELESQLAEG